MTTRGVYEVPINKVKVTVDWEKRKVTVDDKPLHDFLVDLRETVVQLRATQAPLPVPTNFRGTALAFAALLEWTRVQGADYYEILWNSTPTLITATVQGVADSQRWIDNVGQTGIKRFYWVRARKFTGAKSAEAGSVAVTTLAAAAGVAPVAPPPPGHVIVTDSTSGHIVYVPYTRFR